MELQVGVKVILEFQEKILLLKRSPKYQEIVGIWDVPGGRIDSHETLFEGLAREIKEETNIGKIDISQAKLLTVQDIMLNQGIHTVRITYKLTLLEEPKVEIDLESQEFKWFNREELVSCETLNQFLRETLQKSGYL
jgi:8-oxo-dGTP diphosphatase